MESNVPENEEIEADLPAIEFHSPGRFDVHNPVPDLREPAPWEPAPFVLGQHDTLQRFAKPEEARAHALALLQQAQRNLNLYTPDLESWLYHHSSIQTACTRFLLANPRNRLRILIRDVTRPVKEGHRLLNLVRRLSSNSQIRRLNPDHANDECAYLLVDDRGLLMRPELDSFAGYALYNDPGRCRLRQVQFDQAWDQSVSDPDLRSFLL
ncbi:histone acetyltransferase HPA2 [Pseudomonas sp. 1D4]|uniref:DUF7931 domain-containing protein n=1 Tax=unclassified Pseudomonas TaxID=196821 RepID=UPI00084AFEED|nr:MULTISPECIES: histone acetyltransferase HPA2 [unclassified Pseudomonas]OEC43193.1 histone acetyltransferase HPA2 [Pseudomonas sp. 1D4]OEC59512.1 histone acetyltransferase HPA2 [Pseudomonas sp. ENNP23]